MGLHEAKLGLVRLEGESLDEVMSGAWRVADTLRDVYGIAATVLPLGRRFSLDAPGMALKFDLDDPSGLSALTSALEVYFGLYVTDRWELEEL